MATETSDGGSKARTELPELHSNSRPSCGYLAIKYGFRNLERLRICAAIVPKNLPSKRRIRLMARLMGLPFSKTKAFWSDFEKFAPVFLEEKPFDTDIVVLAPPMLHCVHKCEYVSGKHKGTMRPLIWHREPTQVTIFCGAGEVKQGLAVTLRCLGCQSRYSYSTWTNYDSSTYTFYDTEQEYLDVSQEVYVCRRFALEIVNQILFNHATYEGIAETMRQTYQWNSMFSRKTVAATFFRHEIECDIREHGLHPYYFDEKESILQYLEPWMEGIFSGVYQHECSDACVSRQCGKLFIVDGLWKIVFRHCTAKVTNVIEEIPLINFPNVCTNQPEGNSLFCTNHQYKNAAGTGKTADPETMSIHMTGVSRALRSQALKDVNELLSGELSVGSDAFTCRKFDPNELCKKNKGQASGGHLYSRGYLFLVGPTGNIFAFSPIYRAESLGQVFLFLISTLYQLLQDIAPEEWDKVFLCYDNICQLNRLRAANQPLPLPHPFDEMWARISKIVDGLHIQNHKDPGCRTKYHPDKFYDCHPQAQSRNTMAAEQTFSWIAKFRKQLNAMNKARQLFFLHRMIVRRNAYVSRCLAEGRRPVGGTMRAFKDMN